MKNQATWILVTAALIGLAKGGWVVDDGKVKSTCANNGTKRVCFTSDTDFTNLISASNFNGYMSNDTKSFVIYGGQGDTGLVSLQAKDYTVTVSFTDKCAVGDVQNNQGVSVDNGAWCDDQTPRWIHVPA